MTHHGDDQFAMPWYEVDITLESLHFVLVKVHYNHFFSLLEYLAAHSQFIKAR